MQRTANSSPVTGGARQNIHARGAPPERSFTLRWTQEPGVPKANPARPEILG